MTNPQKHTINGVFLLDKPIGISSNTAMQKARGLFRAKKAGHTGVLDPLASGLLPICFGEATKFAQYLLDSDKTYTATLKLGEATTTGDSEGEIIATHNKAITQSTFQNTCHQFIGQIAQIPPMFSALKYEGKPLYEYARQGIVIERKSRLIQIHSLHVEAFHYPEAIINVACSKGTYIRTLAEDLAKHMGTFAHLTALRRTATAGFSITQATTLEKLAHLSETEKRQLLLPCDALLTHLPTIQLNTETTTRIRLGQRIPFPNTQQLAINQPIRAYTEQNEFIGLVAYQAHSAQTILKAVRLLSSPASLSP